MSNLSSAPAGRDNRPSTAPDEGEPMWYAVLFTVLTAVLDVLLSVLVVRDTPARLALGLSALLLVIGVLAWLGAKHRRGASSRGIAWGQLSWWITVAVASIVNAIVAMPLMLSAPSGPFGPFGPLYAAWLVVAVADLSVAVSYGRTAWHRLGLMPALPPTVTATEHFSALVWLGFYSLVTFIVGCAGQVTTLGTRASNVFGLAGLLLVVAVLACVVATAWVVVRKDAEGGLCSRASVRVRLVSTASVGAVAIVIATTMVWLIFDAPGSRYAGCYAVLALCLTVVIGGAVRLGRQARITLRVVRQAGEAASSPTN